MKLLLSVLMLLPLIVCYSQDMRIDLSAKGERLSISLDVNNSNRTFSLKKTGINPTEYFTATIFNEEIDTTWQRSFTIHNAADSQIAVLKPMNSNTYSISLSE